ncbi:MAG TPA: CBS domain-containing protein [Anaeromyxobacteraceae bacterium]|nr:CBS domain-containing protein [Anaeromyxobacteraceae bacterium]
MATIDKSVTRELVSLDAGDSSREAARRMAQKNIGSVAVREGLRTVGLVTERDLVIRLLARGAPTDVPVREIMRLDLPFVTPATSDAECTALMREHGTRHLLVRESGEVVGVISMRDLLRLMLAEREWLIGQLQTFIDGRDGPRQPPTP